MTNAFVNCEACGKAGVPQNSQYITQFGLTHVCGDRCFRLMNLDLDLKTIKQLARKGGNNIGE